MNSDKLYAKLQSLAGKHAGRIYRNFRHAIKARGRQKYIVGIQPISNDSYIVTDLDHQQTVEILGSGDDNQIAARIHWYLDNFPDFFDGSTLGG